MPRIVNSGLSSLRFVGRALGGFPVVVDVLAVMAVVVAVASPASLLGRGAVLAVVLMVGGRIAYEANRTRRRGTTKLWMGTKTLPRVVTVASALAVGLVDRDDAATFLAAGALMLLVIGEQAIRRPVRSAVPQVANLPGWDVPLPSTRLANVFFAIDTLGVALLALVAVFDLTRIPVFIAIAAGVVLSIRIALQSVRFLVQRNRFEANLPQTLEKLGPVFAFHWQAPAGTAYQAAMWLPYLERIGVPYFVLTRTIANFREISKMTDAPVILRIGLEDLDRTVTPTLKVVFYANTAVRNSHMIRFPHLTHVQLNHGDSDKIASVSPTFRQYDRNFVAGQAAIDRFATHGVQTLASQFEIVGRPQLEHVQQAAAPMDDTVPRTVLYSPTWSGFYDDSDYSSLSAGPQIIQTLLARGCVVVFRPHPYARRHPGNTQACKQIIDLLARDVRENGRPHVFGPAAETEMSVVDCFNASDAMISDVSSLSSDYLMSSKPFAMAAVSAQGDAFVAGFPLARAAYVFDVVNGSPVDLTALVDDMLGPDSMGDQRRSLRSYYLSDTPPERIAERFLETARRYL